MSTRRTVFAAAIALAVVACTDAPLALDPDLEPAFAIAEVFTDPSAFATATATLGVPTVIDFEDIDASPVNNSTAGRDPFDGSTYANQGIIFSNPNNLPLYIAPGGLFWNASNSLSVNLFPFEGPGVTDDDLVVSLDPPARAVGFTFVDNASFLPDEFVQFIDSKGDVVQQVGLPQDFEPFRAFLGIVSVDRPIATINIVEAANDGDDVDYDDFIFISGRGGRGGGRVVVSASGNAILPPGTSPFRHRTFTFTAREYNDGSVTGQWTRVHSDPQRPLMFNGIVVCMSKEGNQVFVGTRTVGGVGNGREGAFSAVDNGPRPDATDQITLHHIRAPGSGFAADYCADENGAREQPDVSTLFTINDFGPGQITIRP